VKALNCSNWSPDIGDWCDNTQFNDIKYDPAKAADLMAKSGYKKDSSGIWAKNGQELNLKWAVTTGNRRRADTQTEFIPLLKKEGWSIATDNSDPDTLFQQRLPAGDYDFAMFIQVTSPDPSVKSILACDQIPGPANDGQGQNQWWWCNQKATDLIDKADAELDTAKRTDLIHQIGQYVRDDYVTFPLYIFPAMATWRTDKVEGPIDQFINSPESNFWNIWDWSVK